MYRKLLSKAVNSISHRYFPASLKLAGMYAAYMIDTPEAELKHLELLLLSGRRTAVDVGANVGLWTYKMAALFDQVVSFEMNEECYRHIEACGRSNVTLHKHGLSNREQRMTLYVPVLESGFVSHGWATVEVDRRNTLFENCLERQCLVKPLDSYALEQVDFIKIDVEGHELSVIDGAMQTIRLNKPVLVVETSEDCLQKLTEILLPLGYSIRPLRHFLAADGTQGNYIFMPNGYNRK